MSNKCSSRTNKYQESDELLARGCLVVGGKLFSCWICIKIIKNDSRNTVNRKVNKLLTKWRLLFTKSHFFNFYPTDLVNTLRRRVARQRQMSFYEESQFSNESLKREQKDTTGTEKYCKVCKPALYCSNIYLPISLKKTISK